MRGRFMRVLMAVRCAGRNRRFMGMIVVVVVVGMLMSMRDVFVGMRVRMVRHRNLLLWLRVRGIGTPCIGSELPQTARQLQTERNIAASGGV